MKIECAELVGLISPTGHETGFMIPIFSALDANYFLVQAVDSSNAIESFNVFEAAATMVAPPLRVVKQVGDLAFWCFALPSGEYISGSIIEIAEKIGSAEYLISEQPFLALQLLCACGRLDSNLSVLSVVNLKLNQLYGKQLSSVFAESVLTQHARDSLRKMFRVANRSWGSAVSEVHVIVGSIAQIYVPPVFYLKFNQQLSLRRRLVNDVQKRADYLKLFVAADVISWTEPERKTKRSEGFSVAFQKRRIAACFSNVLGLPLQQETKSYFSSGDGNARCVCTLSSRYDGSQKRKYWYGFHKIWDEWLEEVPSAYVLLGCRDTNVYYALPLSFMRHRLRFLRWTGRGRDRYWHLDLILGASDSLELAVPGHPELGRIDEFKLICDGK